MAGCWKKCAVAAAMAVLSAAVPTAHAGGLETVVQDDALLLHGSDEQVRTGFERIRELGFDRVRLTAGWSVLAPQADGPDRPAFDATDPAAYPAGNWAHLDRAVRMAREARVGVMIDIAFWAPRWATREPAEATGRFANEIDAGEYGKFAEAVARRYSGAWIPLFDGATAPPEPEPSPDRTLLEELFKPTRPASGSSSADAPPPTAEPLPAVDVFTIWNEPNHPGFVRPQWKQVDGRWVPRSAEIYRDMVRAAYPAIKRAVPGSRVLIGGTAAFGSSTPNLSGVPPLRFLRALACVDDELRPVSTGTCEGFQRLPGDGWAHHPYSLRTTPDVDPRDRDKLPVAATGRLAATLRALVAAGRLAPAVADLYMTEYGYETNAPDPRAPFALGEQARLLAWAEFIATSDPAVKMWPQFQLYDRPSEAPRPGLSQFADWQSGLFFADGSPKPSAAVYRTPVFASCGSGGRVSVWGRFHGASSMTSAIVETRSAPGGWSAAPGRAAAAVPPGGAFTRTLRHQPGASYRLRWTSSEGERVSPAAEPEPGACARARVSRAAKAKGKAKPKKRRRQKRRAAPVR